MTEVGTRWDGALVRRWLVARIAAARADQVAAQRAGRGGEGDCDKAAAEEMVCAGVNSEDATADQAGFAAAVKALLDREVFVWRGVYDDDRFDRHVRGYGRKLIRMAKANEGFENLRRYS